jgi:hypothetical protein
MKKLMCVLVLILAVVISQTMFAQDKPVEKKVEKVVTVKKTLTKECKDTVECCKDKKCCDKCTGDKCDGKCCAKCAEGKKTCTAKCEMSNKCAMDSTAKCEKHDMKKHMEKKAVIKKKVKVEETK